MGISDGLFGSVLDVLNVVTEKSGDKLGSVTNAEKVKQQRSQETASQAKKTYSNPTDNAFQEQIPKLTKRLFGESLQKRFNLFGRFIPKSIKTNTLDTVFLKIAQLAEQWSKLERDEYINKANTESKQELLLALANRHRALAATGSGITGLTGVIGTLADLLWLLLLSLKLIYNTAAIYGEDLTGVEGAKRAFDILGNADLSMLTEKQAVLISINAAGELADDIDLHVLEGLIKTDDASFFKEAITSITEQLNVSLNFDWLLKFLPVATGVTSAVYSVYIINEISAVAQAEYAENETVKQLTQDS